MLVLVPVLALQSTTTSTQEYAGVYRSIQEYAGVHRSIREYTGVYGSAQECTGESSIQECTGEHASIQECAGACRSTQEYTGALVLGLRLILKQMLFVTLPGRILKQVGLSRSNSGCNFEIIREANAGCAIGHMFATILDFRNRSHTAR